MEKEYKAIDSIGLYTMVRPQGLEPWTDWL